MRALIVAELENDQLRSSLHHVVSAACQLATDVSVLVMGSDTRAAAEQAASIAGVARVVCVQAPHLAHPLAEDVANIIVDQAVGVSVVMAAHGAFAKNALPRAAALLDVAMLTDVIEIVSPGTYARPVYSGNVVATVQNTETVQVLTVRASRFARAGEQAPAEILHAQVGAPANLSRWLSEARNTSERPELSTARVIVTGGRALGSAEQFEALLDPLAAKLQAALGASRAAVDAGYAPNDIQVGQTGITVAPDVYFAIGVSGAIQHAAGIKDSKVIVVVNHDPDAPIFQIADYGLVADLFEAVPAIMAALS